MKPYQLRESETRYKNLGNIGISVPSSFKVKRGKGGQPDVPIRRFGPINTKIKPFPLLETSENLFLHDFGDGFGEVYAYRWKNDPNQGIVSFWARFENDSNIYIDKNSTVSSNCFMFAGEGTISIIKSNIISTQMWAKGSIKISKCKTIQDCYIFGSVNFVEIELSERNRFFTTDCSLTKCNVIGNNLFYQDQVDYSGSISIEPKANISGHVEIIGNVTVNKNATVSDRAKVSGNVTIGSNASVTGDAYINSGPRGFITISEGAQISENAIILNNATIGGGASVSGMALVTDSAMIGSGVSLSGQCCVLDNAIVGSGCSISGKAIINMSANLDPQVHVSGNGIATGMVSVKSGTTISGYGIVAGNGTVKNGGSVSGSGRVFDGVECEHGVSGGHRHWDNRSCKNQIDILLDEREGCVAPCLIPPCPMYMPPPTIC